MVASSVLGFPRIGTFSVLSFYSHLIDEAHTGANREVKKAVEAYWAGKLSSDDLTKVAADVKKESWTSVKSKGVKFIPR